MAADDDSAWYIRAGIMAVVRVEQIAVDKSSSPVDGGNGGGSSGGWGADTR